MKHNKGFKSVTLCVLAAFFLTVFMAPADALAKWHPQELPGYDDDEILKQALMVAGAVVVLGIIIKASKHKADAPAEEETPADAPQDSTSSSLIRPEDYALLCSSRIGAVKQPKFVPYVDLLPKAGRLGGCKGNSFSIGLALNF